MKWQIYFLKISIESKNKIKKLKKIKLKIIIKNKIKKLKKKKIKKKETFMQIITDDRDLFFFF